MTYVAAVLVLVGAFFMLVAAIGVLRFPDLLMRMHAATKAGTLGAGFVLIAAALIFGGGPAVRALAVIAFLFLTAPVASHVIARAAYRSRRIRLWEGTVIDELQQEVMPEGSPPGRSPDLTVESRPDRAGWREA